MLFPSSSISLSFGLMSFSAGCVSSSSKNIHYFFQFLKYNKTYKKQTPYQLYYLIGDELSSSSLSLPRATVISTHRMVLSHMSNTWKR